LTCITPETVELSTPQGKLSLENNFVLAMTGYKPDFTFIESLGVKLNDDEFNTPVYDEKTNESNSKNVFLAGVVCGGLKTNKWFIENSREHAKLIISTISSRKDC
jgi:thioredoxin reductase